MAKWVALVGTNEPVPKAGRKRSRGILGRGILEPTAKWYRVVLEGLEEGREKKRAGASSL